MTPRRLLASGEKRKDRRRRHRSPQWRGQGLPRRRPPRRSRRSPWGARPPQASPRPQGSHRAPRAGRRPGPTSPPGQCAARPRQHVKVTKMAARCRPSLRPSPSARSTARAGREEVTPGASPSPLPPRPRAPHSGTGFSTATTGAHRPRDLPVSQRRRFARALCSARAANAARARSPSLLPHPARPGPRRPRRAPAGEGDGLPPLPAPAGLSRAADLKQELDPLDGRHRSLADGGGDAARQKVLEEGDSLVRHVRAAPEPPGERRRCRSSRKGGTAAAHELNAGRRQPRPPAPHWPHSPGGGASPPETGGAGSPQGGGYGGRWGVAPLGSPLRAQGGAVPLPPSAPAAPVAQRRVDQGSQGWPDPSGRCRRLRGGAVQCGGGRPGVAGPTAQQLADHGCSHDSFHGSRFLKGFLPSLSAVLGRGCRSLYNLRVTPCRNGVCHAAGHEADCQAAGRHVWGTGL